MAAHLDHPRTAEPVRNRRRHQRVFAAAGIYNLAWGTWVALQPDALYRFMHVPVPSHPEVAACLGMVIALYGVVYLEVARVPEHGFVPAAVGLAGKVLGPLGLFWSVAHGTWPTSAVWVVVGNDLVWWIPFAMYLRDAWPLRTALTADAGVRDAPRPTDAGNF